MRWTPGWLLPAALALLALLLWGCSAAQYSSETCRLERQRSKQVSRSRFCEAAGPGSTKQRSISLESGPVSRLPVGILR
jgi:hypothetical protein